MQFGSVRAGAGTGLSEVDLGQKKIAMYSPAELNDDKQGEYKRRDGQVDEDALQSLTEGPRQ